LGVVDWTKDYTVLSYVDAYVIHTQRTTDAGYMMTGNTLPAYYEGDVVLLKTDSLGDTLWTQVYGGLSPQWGVEGYQTSDGGYIILAGWWYEYIPTEGIWLFKTDSIGSIIWSTSYTGQGIAAGNALQMTADGGYIITGSTSPTIDDYSDVYIVKTDSLGDIIWSTTYGGSESDIGNDIIIDHNGGYIIAANSQSFGGAWLLRINENGDTLWTQIYPGKSFSSIQQTDNNCYILCGHENADLLLMRTNSTGLITWTSNYGGQSGEQANDMQITGDDGYIIIGFTESYGAGSRDIWLLRIAADTLGISEQKIVPREWSTKYETITHGQLLYPEGNTYKIFDITGRQIHTLNPAPGIYFIEVDGEIRQKVIKVK
jgi:hypothetical protein